MSDVASAKRAVIGLVVIGRNEGERLVRCLRSVVGRADAVVYVDSGSTDGSVARARELGAVVVELDMARPFTAARARNEGVEALVGVRPGVEYVQFVDGDCEISAGWLERAAGELDARPEFAVVCGRLRELNRNATWYNRLCDIERDLPEGETDACGGIAMMRVGPVREVGGFDANLIAGEEPELCLRLRKKGWRIYRSGADMGLHDAAMTKFSQWWKRMKRPGYAHSVGLEMYGRREGAQHLREVRSVWFWAVGVPAMALGLAWVTRGWSLLLLGIYPVQLLRIYVRSRRRMGLSGTDAAVFATSCVLAKWPALVGQLEYYRLKAQGKRAAIIEYKGAAAPAAVATR
jgi:GT2 family glycosyltransferase